MTKKQPRYIVTGFYCPVCKHWHYEREPEFFVCLDKYNFAFKVERERE